MRTLTVITAGRRSEATSTVPSRPGCAVWGSDESTIVSAPLSRTAARVGPRPAACAFGFASVAGCGAV